MTSMAGCPSDSLERTAACNIESVLTELASDQDELAAELTRRSAELTRRSAELTRRSLDGIQQGLADAREVSRSLGRLQQTLIASQS
jgi:hypothetical protein